MQTRLPKTTHPVETLRPSSHEALQPTAQPETAHGDADFADFEIVPPNRRLADFLGKAPAEQDLLAQHWTPEDLQLLSDDELSQLKGHTEATAATKRSSYSPLAWASKAVGGRPYLENIQKLGASANAEIARRKEQALTPFRHANDALLALSSAPFDARAPLLNAAMDALQKLPNSPIPDGFGGEWLHRAIQSGDPRLSELAIRELGMREAGGTPLLYQRDANGFVPSSYLRHEPAFLPSMLALKELGFNPDQLEPQDREHFDKARTEIAKNIALKTMGVPQHYWAGLTLANAALKWPGEASSTAVGRTVNYNAELKNLSGGRGKLQFWPRETGTTPLHILVQAGDSAGIKNLVEAFGTGWNNSVDSQGKRASDYANSQEIMDALKRA